MMNCVTCSRLTPFGHSGPPSPSPSPGAVALAAADGEGRAARPAAGVKGEALRMLASLDIVLPEEVSVAHQ